MIKEDVFREIQEIAAFLVHKGWAERNAGNYSYRLDEEDFKRLVEVVPEYRYRVYLDVEFECLGGFYALLVSVGNSRFRDVAKDPLAYCGIVLYENGRFSFISTHESVKPTSELVSHLMIHQYLAENNPNKKAVLHSHPTYLIAFSHRYYGFTKEKLNELLEEIMPEVGFYIPKRTGFVELITPGSGELAQATLKELADHDVVVWKKHGCLAVAETLWDAFDMMDILDKAAQIRLLI
jgi:rhamnulose-1-phosphate aldolase